MFLGPSLGFKLSGKARIEPKGLYPDIDLPQLKAFDPGVVVGAGASLGRGPVRGLVDLRYSTGLSGVFKSSPGSLDAINSVFSLMLGVSY